MAWRKREKKFKGGERVVIKKYAKKNRYGCNCARHHPVDDLCVDCPAFNGRPVRIFSSVPYGYYINGLCGGARMSYIEHSMLMHAALRVWRKL